MKQTVYRFIVLLLLACASSMFLWQCKTSSKSEANPPQARPKYFNLDKWERSLNAKNAKSAVREIAANLNRVDPAERRRLIRILEKITGSESAALLKKIVQRKDFSNPTRREALYALIRRDEKGTPEFALGIVRKNEAFYDSVVKTYLFRRAPPGFLPYLKLRAEKNPSGIDKETIHYFARKKYKPAVPLLKTTLKNGPLREVCAQSLLIMTNPEVDRTVYKHAENPASPERRKILNVLLKNEDKKVRQEGRKILQAILRNREKEKPAAMRYAIETAGRINSPVLREELKNIYRQPSLDDAGDNAGNNSGDDQSENADYRTRALNALLTGSKMNAYLLSRELHFSLVSLQASLSSWDRKPVPLKKSLLKNRSIRSNARVATARSTTGGKRRLIGPMRNRTNRKVSRRGRKSYRKGSRSRSQIAVLSRSYRPDNKTYKNFYRIRPRGSYPRSKAAYRRSLYKAYRAKISRAKLGELLGRMGSALRSHAESKDAVSRFMVRAYKREFRIDDAEAKKRIARGINLPGGLNAVLRNIYREYPDERMRMYVLARFFSVSRRDAAIIWTYLRR